MNLRSELKKRAATRTAIDSLPPEISEPFTSGQVGPNQVPDALDEISSNIVTDAVNRRKISPEQAPQFKAHLHRSFGHMTPGLQAVSYRKVQEPNAPVSPGEVGMTFGMQAAFPFATTGIGNVISKLKGGTQSPYPSLGHAAFGWLHPSQAMGLGAFTTAFTAAKPFSDPLYNSGKRSYLTSLHEGIKGEAANLGERGNQARERYGLAGIPVQALHGLLNPISSLYYGATSVGDLLRGKEGSALVTKAEAMIDKALDKLS